MIGGRLAAGLIFENSGQIVVNGGRFRPLQIPPAQAPCGVAAMPLL